MQDILPIPDKHSARYLGFIHLPVAFVDVVFGMPSRKCRGYGICKIDLMSQSEFKIRLKSFKPIYNRALATLHTLDPERILLRVYSMSLDKFTLNKHFRREYFAVREPLTLELPEVLFLPASTRRVEILRGNYPFVRDDKFIHITMKFVLKEGDFNV